MSLARVDVPSLGRQERSVLRPILAATLAPLATFGVQRVFWSALSPFAWFLFYPSVFFSSCVGGFWSGIGASVLSTVLVWSAFLPDEGWLRLQTPRDVVSSLVFLAMGVALSIFNGRLQRANRHAVLALAESQDARKRFQALVN